jgi:hypothetical protein
VSLNAAIDPFSTMFKDGLRSLPLSREDARLAVRTPTASKVLGTTHRLKHHGAMAYVPVFIGFSDTSEQSILP